MEGLLYITKPFREKYTLFIETEMKAVSIASSSLARIRWEFCVLRIGSEELEIELIRLDNDLLRADNPLTKEVQQVSDIFAKMYNELHLILALNGKVKEIVNLDIIQDKWHTVKSEMEKSVVHTPEIKDVLLLNDQLFASREKIIQAIQSNEFFSLYFHQIYGSYFPSESTSVKQYNFFNTALLHMTYKKAVATETVDQVQISVKGYPRYGWDNFSKQAYSAFEDKIAIQKINAKITDNANCIIEKKNGKLLELSREKYEEADEKQLYVRINYHLYCEERYREFLQQSHMSDSYSTQAK